MISAKSEADNLKTISIWQLKKSGFLRGWCSGVFSWTNRWSDTKSSIGVDASTTDGGGHVRIYYTQTDEDGSKEDFDYKVPLTTTPCRYGGKRYWFVCPMYRDGKHCGRRVGVLYKEGKYFACRHCYNLTYASRNLSGRFKAIGSIVSIPEIEELEQKAKRQYYRGKLTKKYQRYMEKMHKSEQQIIAIGTALRL